MISDASGCLEKILVDLDKLRCGVESDRSVQAESVIRILNACAQIEGDPEGLASPHAQDLLSFGKEFFTQWELRLEGLYGENSNTSSRHTESDEQVIRSRYVDFYRSLVGAELSLCPLNPSTRVCHIGCGPLPVSLFLWHKRSGCFITGVDCDANASLGARAAFVHKVEQDPTSYDSDKVCFLSADGGDISYGVFDVVLLSSSVRGKARIFDQILATSPANVRIIERTPRLFWKHLAYWETAEIRDLLVRGTVQVDLIESRILVRE
jgi:hypothetical protein